MRRKPTFSFTYKISSPEKVLRILKGSHHIGTCRHHIIHHLSIHTHHTSHHPATREEPCDDPNNEQDNKNDEQNKQNSNKSLICSNFSIHTNFLLPSS